MKIGIVTFFFTNNYGGVIQALALQEYLKSLGHDAEFVNFNPKAPKTGFLRAVARSTKRRLYSLFDARTRFDLNFTVFTRQHLRLGPRCKTYADVGFAASSYDMVIAGSDQIWNTRLNGEHVSYYLLEFAHKRGIKTASYGSCVGQPEQAVELLDRFAANVNSISFLSVRNQFSKDLISRFTDHEIVKVLDPTFLIDLSAYASPFPLKTEGRFVLVYCLNENHSALAQTALDEILKDNDLRVVVLHSKYRIKVDRGAEEIFDATPNQWLWFFGAAEFVLTDSFHGMIFSLKNKKRFCALHDNGWRSFRINDLAEQLDLGAVCVHEKGQIAEAIRFDIDYDEVGQRLSALVRCSKEFLSAAAGSIK